MTTDSAPRTSGVAPSVLAAVLALASVGAAFVWKYGTEVSPLGGAAALVFAVLYAGTVGGACVLAPRLNDRTALRIGYGLGAVLLLATIALALGTPVENGVARLPALAVWLDRLADGVYPYGLPIRPSGFPILFALAAPFWVARLLVLLPVVGLLAFSATLRRWPPRQRLAPLVGLALLPSFHYEVVVHSELFFNAALVLAALPVIDRMRRGGWLPLVLAAAIAGGLLSTRLFVGAVFAVWGAYAFRSDWTRGAVFASVALIVWSATWLPFWAWDAELFAAFGPFAVQSLYLPPLVVGAAVLIALGLGWTADGLGAVIARTGWLLLGLVVLSGLWTIDFDQPLARFAGFDVGYLILPTPFLLAALAGRFRSENTATRSDISELSTPAGRRAVVSSSVTLPEPSRRSTR